MRGDEREKEFVEKRRKELTVKSFGSKCHLLTFSKSPAVCVDIFRLKEILEF